MNTDPVVIEKELNASAEEVWAALTEYDQMKQWYFDLPGFKAEKGYEFEFLAGDDQKKFKHLCKVTAAVPQKKLAYTWRYEGYPGDSEVSFDLTPSGDKTKLIITHTGIETIAPGNKDFDKENFRGGWTHFGNAIAQFVNKSKSTVK